MFLYILFQVIVNLYILNFLYLSNQIFLFQQKNLYLNFNFPCKIKEMTYLKQFWKNFMNFNFKFKFVIEFVLLNQKYLFQSLCLCQNLILKIGHFLLLFLKFKQYVYELRDFCQNLLLYIISILNFSKILFIIFKLKIKLII